MFAVVETEHNQPEATMKTPLQALLTSLFLLGPLATAAPEWHTFNNADGSRNFKAAMIGCDSRAATITVRMRGSRQHTTFKIALLSEEDQAYARAKGKELAAVSGFRFRFDKQMTKTGAQQAGDTKVTTYDGGYAISIINHCPEHVEDITVDYILVWRKDSFEGVGEDQLVKGSHSISTVIAGVNEEISATGIKMESRVERGGSSSTGGCCGKGGTVSTRALRSRDLLVGCLVQIKVAGKVVKTGASSDSLLKKHQGQFDSTE